MMNRVMLDIPQTEGKREVNERKVPGASRMSSRKGGSIVMIGACQTIGWRMGMTARLGGGMKKGREGEEKGRQAGREY